MAKSRLRDAARALDGLIYLYPFGDTKSLLGRLGDVPEFRQARILLQCCASRDVTELLWYPGAPVAAYSQLWAESETASPVVEWSSQMSAPQRDAAATLALTNVIRLPEKFLVDQRPATDASFLRFCNSNIPTGREFDDFSYIDELRSLQLGANFQNMSELLATRYDEDEDPSLEGLGFSSGVYS